MDIEGALSFAATRHDGVLTTIKRDGRPQLSNITYLVGDGRIRISITADRAKFFNLSHDARATLYVAGDDFWHFAVIDGDAALAPIAADPHDATVEALIEVYRGVLGEHPDWDEYRRAMVTDRRTVVTITPTHAYGRIG